MFVKIILYIYIYIRTFYRNISKTIINIIKKKHKFTETLWTAYVFFNRSCLFIKNNVLFHHVYVKYICSVFVFCFFFVLVEMVFNDFCIFILSFFGAFFVFFVYLPQKMTKNAKNINKNKQIIKTPLTKHNFYINKYFFNDFSMDKHLFEKTT